MKYYVDKGVFPSSIIFKKTDGILFRLDWEAKWVECHGEHYAELVEKSLNEIINSYPEGSRMYRDMAYKKLIVEPREQFYKQILEE